MESSLQMGQTVELNSRNLPGERSYVLLTKDGVEKSICLDRQHRLDSGASIHKMSQMELSPEELETANLPRLPTTVITANGSLDTTEEATVYVRDLDMFVAVQLLENTPAV